MIPPGSGKGCTFVLTTPVFAYPRYDISSDGWRFNVVLNWFEELKERVPTG